MVTITTQQVMGFIQNKIAETHAAGVDILTLLESPEVAFSLQILEGDFSKAEKAPANAITEDETSSETEQVFLKDDTHHE